MLSQEQFSLKLICDFKNHFARVEIGNGNTLIVGSSVVHACISMANIYKEYVLARGQYTDVLKSYIEIIKEVITQYIYKINYSAVYPIIKNNNFGAGESLSFYRKSWFCDLDILWVEDFGSTFRFLQKEEVIDEERLHIEGCKNISKLSNKLKKLDKSLNIYAFYFANDLCSSLLLDSKIQAEINRKISKNILICIPSNCTVLIAKYTLNPAIVDILEKLMLLDNNPNNVSKKIYACVDGEYSIVSKEEKGRSIKMIE